MWVVIGEWLHSCWTGLLVSLKCKYNVECWLHYNYKQRTSDYPSIWLLAFIWKTPFSHWKLQDASVCLETYSVGDNWLKQCKDFYHGYPYIYACTHTHKHTKVLHSLAVERTITILLNLSIKLTKYPTTWLVKLYLKKSFLPNNSFS